MTVRIDDAEPAWLRALEAERFKPIPKYGKPKRKTVQRPQELTSGQRDDMQQIIQLLATMLNVQPVTHERADTTPAALAARNGRGA